MTEHMMSERPGSVAVHGGDSAAFPDVDHALEPHALIDFMDTARTLPGLRIAKSLALRALGLRPGHHVADIGCGPGEDAREMARRVVPGGSVTGVDVSEVMLDEARRRAGGLPVTFRTGNAVDLPLGDAVVDRCRADTLLQHVPDPARVVAELVRVTRPGGRIALLEFDQATLAIDHPDRPTTRLIQDEVTQAFAQGWAGRGLRRLLAAAGAADITVDALWVDSDHPFLRRLLAPSLHRLIARGDMSASTADRWQQELDQAAAAGRLTAGAVVFVAAGNVR